MRGQLSIEYLFIVGLLLIVLIPIVFLAWQYSQTTSETVQAQSAINTILEGCNLVYAQGPGAQTKILIFLPYGVNSTSITGKEVDIKILEPSGTTDVFGLANGNLTGGFSTTPGEHQLTLQMLINATVNISEG